VPRGRGVGVSRGVGVGVGVGVAVGVGVGVIVGVGVGLAQGGIWYVLETFVGGVDPQKSCVKNPAPLLPCTPPTHDSVAPPVLMLP